MTREHLYLLVRLKCLCRDVVRVYMNLKKSNKSSVHNDDNN